MRREGITDSEIVKSIDDNDRAVANRICEALRSYKGCIDARLASFVSAVCNVDIEDFASPNREVEVAQTRWLYWYAYRYMTNSTYKAICDIHKRQFGKVYTAQNVAASVKKMTVMIDREPIWKKRWHAIRNIIKSQHEVAEEPPIPITITVPKNVEVTIKKE